jgi:hypothetical protein
MDRRASGKIHVEQILKWGGTVSKKGGHKPFDGELYLHLTESSGNEDKPSVK